MQSLQIDKFTLFKYAFVAAIFVAVGVMFVTFFENLETEGTTLGIDNLAYTLDDWTLTYHGRHGLKNPPWSVLALVPIASTVSQRAMWGLLVYFTIAVMIASVPQTRKKWLYWLSVFLLVTSFPALRNIADANLEGLVIAGTLVVIAGYNRQNPLLLAIGALLATVKPQVTLYFTLVIGVYVLLTWPPRKWLQAAGITLAVVIPAMLWRGREWLNSLDNQYQAGSIIDIGLNAALNRLGGIPSPLIFMALAALLVITLGLAWTGDRKMSREKAGMLLAASLLLAPYAAGNSVINVLAIGIIPLFHKRLWIGAALIFLANIFYPFNSPDFARYYAYYWTAYLLLAWSALGWHVWKTEIQDRHLLETGTESTESVSKATA